MKKHLLFLSRFACSLGLACLLLLCSACGQLSNRTTPPEKWLPASTSAVLCVPNVEKARASWKTTRTGQAWENPAADYWRSTQLDPVFETVLKNWGYPNAAPILDLVTGQALIAVEVNPGDQLPGVNKKTAPICWFRVSVALDFGKNIEEAKQRVETDWKFQPGVTRLGRLWDGNTLLLSTTIPYIDAAIARRHGKTPAEGLFAQGVDRETMDSTDAWKKAQANFSSRADAWAFVNVAGVYDVVTVGAERFSKAQGEKSDWKRINTLLGLSGADAFESVMLTTQMRDEGFLTRNAIALRKKSKGFLLPPADAKDLVTPNFATKDVSSFYATRIVPPAEIKRAIIQALSKDNVLLGGYVGVLEALFASKTGVDINQFLGAFGSEFCVMSNEAKDAALGFTLLWEMRDAKAAENSVRTMVRAADGLTSRCALLGYQYDEHAFAKMPGTRFYTAELNGYFMLSTQKQWFENYLALWAKLEKEKAHLKPSAPMGPDSLLPMLNKPFGRVPGGMIVNGRAFSNPASDLRELNSMLPQLLPMLSDHFEKAGRLDLPAQLQKAIPPFTPFAENAFPSVSRTLYDPASGDILTESWGSMDPFDSPFLAAIFSAMGRESFTK
ncbi:TPA: hypothetical protein DDW35_07240 [Candidatus Sumerlaeota bacterium]|jgi:hypothetical protein|nr:hypothetical protein [Candidatus Sumerlaeota bacterium]